MPRTKRRLQVGDWFRLRLPDGSVSVGHTVRVAGNGSFMLAYFFHPLDKTADKGWRALDPADAVTAIVCGGLGITNGEWEVVDNSDVDPHVWPVPEFQRSVPTSTGEQLVAVTKQPDLVNDVTSAPLKPEDAGLRPPDKLFGYGNVPIYVQHLLNVRAPRVGDQPWWQARSGGTSEPARDPRPHQEGVVVRLPSKWDGELEALLESLEEALFAVGEVDGSLEGADEVAVYLYGSEASEVEAVTRVVLDRFGLLQEATLEVRGRPTTPD